MFILSFVLAKLSLHCTAKIELCMQEKEKFEHIVAFQYQTTNSVYEKKEDRTKVTKCILKCNLLSQS